MRYCRDHAGFTMLFRDGSVDVTVTHDKEHLMILKVLNGKTTRHDHFYEVRGPFLSKLSPGK